MILEIVRLVIGGFLVLFVPGFVWSWVFFDKKEIDWLERIALSFGLSIALVPMTVFALNRLFGVLITTLNVVGILAGLIIVGLGLGEYLGRIELKKAMGKIKKRFL